MIVTFCSIIDHKHRTFQPKKIQKKILIIYAQKFNELITTH